MREEKRIQEAHLIKETALKIVEWEKAKGPRLQMKQLRSVNVICNCVL
jgi:hypothetical protein